MNKKVFQKEVMSHNLIGFITFTVLNMIDEYIYQDTVWWILFNVVNKLCTYNTS